METKFLNFFEICGFPLNHEQASRFSLYMRELKRWGRRINLTAIDEDEKIVKILFLGSLSFAQALDFSDCGEVMDYGSGAGFPGLPLKIIQPSLKLTLLESNTKKWSFLKNICRELGFNDAICINQRGEIISRLEEFQSRYTTIVSRATGVKESILSIVADLLKEGGLFILRKGRLWSAETGKKGEGGRKDITYKRDINWHCKDLGLNDCLMVFQKCST